jgi:cbb3-type cytochrome oxidase subunit 3
MLREFVTQAAGGGADIAIAVMLLAIAFFTAVTVWAYRNDRRKHFEDAAQLPLEGESHE